MVKYLVQTKSYYVDDIVYISYYYGEIHARLNPIGHLVEMLTKEAQASLVGLVCAVQLDERDDASVPLRDQIPSFPAHIPLLLSPSPLLLVPGHHSWGIFGLVKIIHKNKS